MFQNKNFKQKKKKKQYQPTSKDEKNKHNPRKEPTS